MNERWKIDANHSSVDFVENTLSLSVLKGNLQDLHATEIQKNNVPKEDALNDGISIMPRESKKDNQLTLADFWNNENTKTLSCKSTLTNKNSNREVGRSVWIGGDSNRESESKKCVTFNQTN